MPPTSISSFVVHNSYVFVVETAFLKILVKPNNAHIFDQTGAFPPWCSRVYSLSGEPYSR